MKKEFGISKAANLFDRIAIGFLSAVLAAITYGLLWSVFAYFLISGFLTIEIFWFFVGVMFLLGFFTLDNYFIQLLVPVWNFIVKIVGR
jgi:hypothetical protein